MSASVLRLAFKRSKPVQNEEKQSFKLASLCLEIISKDMSSPTVFLSRTEQAYDKLKPNMPACQCDKSGI